MITKLEMTEKLITAKIEKGVSWDDVGEALDMSPVWLASVCLGTNSAPAPVAESIAKYFGFDADMAKAIEIFPTKNWDKQVANDPFIYRFYEIAGVYGEALKQVSQDKCGDGIMSAIDFTADVERVADPKGDRVKITLNGKFLPYKSW